MKNRNRLITMIICGITTCAMVTGCNNSNTAVSDNDIQPGTTDIADTTETETPAETETIPHETGKWTGSYPFIASELAYSGNVFDDIDMSEEEQTFYFNVEIEITEDKCIITSYYNDAWQDYEDIMIKADELSKRQNTPYAAEYELNDQTIRCESDDYDNYEDFITACKEASKMFQDELYEDNMVNRGYNPDEYDLSQPVTEEFNIQYLSEENTLCDEYYIPLLHYEDNGDITYLMRDTRSPFLMEDENMSVINIPLQKVE